MNTPRFSFRRVLFVLWLALFPLFFLFWYYPVITLRGRVGTAAVLISIAVGALVVAWPRKRWRWTFIVLYLGFAAIILLPAHFPDDRSALRNAYLEALKSYTGRPYVWGGEGWFGIDCSGLVRKGMEDALARQGIVNFNPALLREANSLYWHDTTASEMGHSYNGRMALIMQCPSLNTLDDSSLQPGDLAVTQSGVHVLAYLGNKTWIAADPIEKKVTIFTVPEKTNDFFSMPMTIVRWNILTDVPAKN